MENVSTYSDVLPTNPATTHWHFDLRYVVWLSVLPSQSGLEGTLNNGLTNLNISVVTLFMIAVIESVYLVLE